MAMRDRRSGSQRRHPGDGAVMREGGQPAQLLVDGLREGEWIEPRPEGRELGDLRRVGLGARLDALEGGLGAIVHAADAGPHPGFADELHGRQEQVLEEPQLMR